MNSRQLLFVQFWLLATIALLYFLGFWLYLNWVFWWYDILLHALGGAWVALATAWLLAHGNVVPSWPVVLLCVIIVGILWEIFEFLIGMPREANYWLDTSLDLLMDVVGGAVGVFLVKHVEEWKERTPMLE